MPRLRTPRILPLGPLAAALATPLAFAQPITYQGSLQDNGQPANDAFDLVFTLFLDQAQSEQVGDPIEIPELEINDGLFTVQLDFGPGSFDPAVNAAQRYLEIQVAPSGSGSYVKLSPLQQITPAPLAIRAIEELWDYTPFGDTYSVGDGNSLISINAPTPAIPNALLDLHIPDTTSILGLGVSTDNLQGSPAYYYQNGRATTHTRLDGLTNTWTVSHNGLDTLNVSAQGRVGIGIQSPLYTLHVIGDALVTGSVATNNTVTATDFVYAAPQTHYYAVAAIDFKPISTVVTGFLRPDGAYYTDPNADFGYEMYAPVHLPDGARITSFAGYGVDNSSNNLFFKLIEQPLLSLTPNELSSLSFSGASPNVRGIVTTLGSSPTIDNENNAYYIVAAAGTDWDGTNTRLTGARIRYTLQSP